MPKGMDYGSYGGMKKEKGGGDMSYSSSKRPKGKNKPKYAGNVKGPNAKTFC